MIHNNNTEERAEEFELNQKKFIQELVHLYKVHTILWDKTHKYYANRTKRSEAYAILLGKCQEYFPQADEDYVRTKIDSLRSTFRREYRKVVASRIKYGADSHEVYKPTLWYYNLLLFLVGEKSTDIEGEVVTVPNKNAVLWSRIHTAKLLLILKKYPCLYSENDENFGSQPHRIQAYKDIADELIKATGRKFEAVLIQKKIQHLRDQYRSEIRKIKRGKIKTTLWCFDLMRFLWSVNPTPKVKKSVEKKNKNEEKKKKSEEKMQSQEEKNETKNNFTEIILQPAITTFDDEEPVELVGRLKGDIYEKIGDNVAHKLRQMDPDQRKVASRLINDILYHGQMEELTFNSQLILQVDDD